MGLKIGQINAQRSKAVAVNLEIIMKERKLDILCIQEPYTFKGTVRGYTSPGLRMIQPNKGNVWVAAIIMDQEIEILQITNMETEHLMCFQVLTKEEQFYIVNVYCQFSLPMSPILATLENILNKLEGNKIIITMDANARSEWWFSGETDERGRELEELVITQKLWVQNKPGNIPTYMTDKGESNIDVTLTTENVKGNILEWKVNKSCTTSDHNMITFKTKGKSVVKNIWSNQEGYNIKKADWDLFKTLTGTHFNERIYENIKNSDTNKATRIFNSVLNKICQESIPKRKLSNRTVPWWNSNLTKLRNEASKAKKQMIRARKLWLTDREDYERRYRNMRNKYTAQIKKDKLEAWKNFVTKTGNEDPWSIAYKVVRNKIKKPNYICSLELPNGQLTTSWQESINALLDKCVPKDSKTNENEKHKTIRVQNEKYINSNLEPEMTQREIEQAIKKLKTNKAPGIDGFKSEVVRALWSNNKEILIYLFNKCLREHTFPDEWKITSLKIILKDSNKDRSKLNSYRPIALIPTLGKVYERIIWNRIMEKYKENGLESNRQYGFKTGHSTEDALLKFRKATNTEKKYVIALFVDIEGAFDNLWWPAIKNRLIKAECSSSLIKIVDSYFKKRRMVIKSKYKEIAREMEKGCPQGSIIGPIAWNCCMDTLLKKLEEEIHEEEAEAIAYADDLAILIKGKSRVELENTGKNVIKIINEWCDINKLKTSSTKTTAIMIKGKFDNARMPILKVYDKNIKYERENKYLGITIDEKLNFITHTKRLREKLTNFIMSIKRLTKEKWGLEKNTMKIMYNAVVIPIVTYGAAFWFDKVGHTLVKRNLIATQRALLLMITKACRTTSTSALQVISGLMPMDLAIVQQGLINNVKRNVDLEWNNYKYRSKENKEDIDLEKEQMLIRREIEKEWQKRWKEDEHGRQTYEFIQRVDYVQKHKWFNPGRNCTYILTGYGPIKSTLFKRGATNDSKCDFCEKEETVTHMLFECENYKEIREEFPLLISEKKDLKTLINSKENYEKFTQYINKMFEKRKTYLETLESRGSASSGQGRATTQLSADVG